MKIYGQVIAPEIEAAAVQWIADRAMSPESGAPDAPPIFSFGDFCHFLQRYLPSGLNFVFAERLLARLAKTGQLRNVAKGIYATCPDRPDSVLPSVVRKGPTARRRASSQDWRRVAPLMPFADAVQTTSGWQGMIRLTDAEWRQLEPLIPPARHGRSRKTDMRGVLNALLHLMNANWYWPSLPSHGLPPRATVAWFFNDFRREGHWSAIEAGLNAVKRNRSVAAQSAVDWGSAHVPVYTMSPCATSPGCDRPLFRKSLAGSVGQDRSELLWSTRERRFPVSAGRENR